jgi:hypothetical protein
MPVESIGPVSSFNALDAAVQAIKAKHDGSLILFRGQNQVYDSIRSGRARPDYRPQPLVESGWSALASKLLGLPIQETHRGTVQAILQHYGCATNFVDVTSDLQVAAWFATHKYSSDSFTWIGNAFRMVDKAKYTALSGGRAYVLVLAIPNPEDLQHRDRLIDLSILPESFVRPARQSAWLLMDRPPTKPLPSDFWVATVELDLESFPVSEVATEQLFPPVEHDGAFYQLSRLPFAHIPTAYFKSDKEEEPGKEEQGGKPSLEGFCMAKRLLNLPEYSEQHDHKWIDLTIYEPHPMRMWKHWRADLSKMYGGIPGDIRDTVKISISPTAKSKLDGAIDAKLAWPDLGSEGCFFTFAELDHDKVIEHGPDYHGVWLQRDSDLILEVPMSSDGETLSTHPGHPYFLRDGRLTREDMDAACKCGNPDSHDQRVASVLRLQHLVKNGEVILLEHPMFGDVWFYAITGDEAEVMDEHIRRGKLIIGTALNMLRSGVSPLSAGGPRTDESEQDGAGQPATRSESDSGGGEKPQPEAEGRSR